MTMISDTPTTFSQWLKRRRRELDLTQDRLAELIGYASPTIQKIERGDRKPSRDLAARLADALAIPPDERDAFLRLARSPDQHVVMPAPKQEQPAVQPMSVLPVHQPTLPLLRTRIQPPPRRRNLVPRERLTARLERNQGGMITLVVAPAGWGKTTLLGMWVAAMPTEERQRIAWLALDNAESEPLRLLQYVVAALQQADPTLGAATLSLLETPQPALDLALMLLVNDLAALVEPVVLILDDYHVLRVPALHQILRFLVDQLPPQLHLIIATRENPPLPLNRLRARGQLHEIRAADLRFTPDEATNLLQALGLTLEPQVIAALEQRLEGWAAGLQLTALALREQNDQNSFITSFVGSHRLALDYLAEEVLAQLPEHILTFLLQTSILDRLCGPLCDAVLGLDPQTLNVDGYSQPVLKEVERANLFLIPLDEAHTWYRYHHLFGTLLRAQLQRGANPALVRELHERAARWYAAQMLWQDAFTHAQSAKQWEIAAEALQVIGSDLLVQGAFTRLTELIEALPEAVRAAYPRLLMLQGLCAARSYHVAPAATLFEQAAATFKAQGDLAGWGEALLHVANCQRTNGDFAGAHNTLQAALTSPLPPRARMSALMSRSYDALVTGDWQAAQTAREAALTLTSEHPDRWLQFELAMSAHSIFLILPGGVEWGERFCRIAKSWNMPTLSTVRAWMLWVEGYVCQLHGDIAVATERIGQALQLSEQLGGLTKLVTDAGLQQVFMETVGGNIEGANQRMAGLVHLLEQPAVSTYRQLFGALHSFVRGWLCIQQGRIAEAQAIASDMERRTNPQEWPFAPCARLLLRGLLALEGGELPSAQQHLMGAVTEQRRFVDALVMGDARVPLAYSLMRAGNTSAASDVFAEALAEQVQRGTPGVLLLAGISQVVPLLQLARAHTHNVPTVEVLLRTLGPTAARVLSPLTYDPDALTTREQEVLRLLVDGAGNQAIADALIISLPTAKTHVAHILAKLGVANRTEAATRAREQGLI